MRFDLGASTLVMPQSLNDTLQRMAKAIEDYNDQQRKKPTLEEITRHTLNLPDTGVRGSQPGEEHDQDDEGA